MSRNDPFAPVRGTSRGPAKAGSGDWEILVPVPAGAKTAPGKHRDLGKPTSIWPYTDQEGKLLGYIARFDGPDGKQFRPLPFGVRCRTLRRPGAGPVGPRRARYTVFRDSLSGPRHRW